MSEEMQTDTPQPAPESPVTEETSAPVAETAAAPAPNETAPAVEAAPAEPAPDSAPAPAAAAPATPPAPRGDRPPREPREPRGDRPPRENRGDRPPRQGQGQGQGQPQGQPNPNKGNERRGQEQRGGGGGGDRRPPEQRDNGPRGGGNDRRSDTRRPEGPVEIEYDKLISDSLYLDNQAHVLVARLRDLDAGTRSQLRRLYGAVRRACRAPEADRQHQFVMLRARLAYTIARHGLRSLDPLEKLLLQVTRRNETRGYDRFRDLFEAIIAYNE
eukprot:TRINITY_DN29759_c0_g1_i1.p1 TRINITY_DN29759_c0_g1~~TRINITY_DN29759_c0_g1_i1.p1  ORF type:complete len:272 (-),score=3.27 TRINITY_DN29759_c0_g1_i1:43-858(-)